MAPSIDFVAPPILNGDYTQLGQHFWNTNLPSSQWTEKCPDFLLGLGDKNISILSSRQEDYHNMTWKEAKELVATNRIDNFQRSPLELRRYLRYMYHLKKHYGSVLSFVQQERLHWDSVTPSGREPFQEPNDLTILYNDWPYGLDPEITHLVVWVKFILEDDQETGFLTPKSHQLIDNFVQQTFCGSDGLPSDRVIWFKNWKSLKSVHALEHFHIMLYQAPADLLARITNNDRPMCEVVDEL